MKNLLRPKSLLITTGIISVSASMSSIKSFRSVILIYPVPLGSYLIQIFLNASVYFLYTSRISSSFEVENPYKITATNRFKKIIDTII